MYFGNAVTGVHWSLASTIKYKKESVLKLMVDFLLPSGEKLWENLFKVPTCHFYFFKRHSSFSFYNFIIFYSIFFQTVQHSVDEVTGKLLDGLALSLDGMCLPFPPLLFNQTNNKVSCGTMRMQTHTHT